MTTATLTLAEFLLARIAEDEAAAQASLDGLWVVGEWDLDPAVVTPDRETGVVVAVDVGGLAEVEHIARHDPARVLADCEAHRRIVALHPLAEGPTYRGTPCCARCTAHGEYAADDAYTDEQNWPCPTLRALALPYADHPDYRESWRP